MNDNQPQLADDILQGGPAIARFTGFKQRLIYQLAANGNLPTFKVGDLVCARKSTLVRWIAEQEARAAA